MSDYNIKRVIVKKTRKDHQCHGCLVYILKGSENIEVTTVSYEGKIYNLYMCDNCKDYCSNQGCNSCMISEDAGEGFIKECREGSVNIYGSL